MNAPAQARIEYDFAMNGPRVAVITDQLVRLWGPPNYRLRSEGGSGVADDAWLHFNEGEARAVYEALADYYGNATNDVRLLRQDYQAERARVDKMIGHLIRPQAV